MGTEIIVSEQQGMIARQYSTVSVAEVTARRRQVVELMTASMTDGIDYGVIPGCAKPTLYQPGAQKLLVLFHLAPEFAREGDCVMEKDFILHSYRCTLYNIPTNLRVSSGIGSCNSREEKYGMRNRKRLCPKCGKAAIIKGKAEYGGGWLCWQKAGKSDGCGQKFSDGDPSIEDQPEGKVPNENIWEQENTIRKMAQKRALVAACLNATGASDIFTQDVEDMPEFGGDSSGAGLAMHRPGHEHQTNFCKECKAAGMPEHCFAVMSNGHIFLKDANREEVEHGPFCPHPQCKKAYADQGMDQRPLVNSPIEFFRASQEAQAVAVPSPFPAAPPAAPPAPPMNRQPAQATTPSSGPGERLITDPQRRRMYGIAKTAGWTDSEMKQVLMERYGIEHSKDVPKAKYEEICKMFQDGISKDIDKANDSFAFNQDAEPLPYPD